MVLGKNLGANIHIYKKPTENIDKLKYLGSLIANNLDPVIEIKANVECVRT